MFRAAARVPLSLLLLSALALHAQTTSTATRDPNALTVVQRALTVLGGSGAVGQIQDCTVQGTLQSFQADGSVISGPFTWQWAGGQVRMQNPGNAGTTTVFVSNGGKPAFSDGGQFRRLHNHVLKSIFATQAPAVVLAQAATDTRYSVQLVGLTTVAGRQAVQLRIQLATDVLTASLSRQDWYLDASTWLPLRVEYEVPDQERADLLSAGATDFGNWEIVSGVWMPFQMKFYLDGQPQVAAIVTSATFNTGLSPTLFTAPVGGAQ